MIRDAVLVAMGELRVACDEAETMTAEKYWPFPTYGDLLIKTFAIGMSEDAIDLKYAKQVADYMK